MSNNIDERVVHLRFDNAQFERDISRTLASLDHLKKSLNMDGAVKGLSNLASAGKSVQLDHIGHQVDGIASRFSAMGIAAVTALATIAHQALATGATLVRSLTIDPIRTGLSEYEINLNSIQTILSNTVAAGVTLEQVNAALQELNLYSDQTIYNFAQMARNIGTFTAAGIALTPAVAAIKGIANLAALSGSNSEQAATAMYQLSQALAAGRVALIDWNSVVNAGMGGTVFQRALAQTAVVMGKLESSAVSLSGDMQTVKINGEAFRNSLQDGWLTADVLTATLAQFTGDLTDAELAAQGFSEAQIASIQAQARSARAAATEVKTLTQTLGALRESAGSGWAQTWQLIFGNFEEAKEMWSAVYNVMSEVIGGSARARNALLTDWKDLGGREALLQSFANAWHALIAILKPIREAFRQIFPKQTAEGLVSITEAIRDFTQWLIIGDGTAEKLRRTFAGVFAVFGIGWEIIKQVASVFGVLLGHIFRGSGDILEITAKIGDFLVALHKAIEEGEGLSRFFNGIQAILLVPIKLIQGLASVLAGLFDKFDTDEAAEGMANLMDKIEPFGLVGQTIADIWDAVVRSFDQVWGMFEPLASKLADFFQTFSQSVSDFSGDVGLDQLIGGVNTGLLAYLVFTFTRLFGRDGLVNNARQILENVNDTLNTMQNTLRAATLLQIALAIGVLTLSVTALSKLDAAQVASSLGAITVLMGQLIASMLILERMPATDAIKLYAMAGAMIILALAVRTLVSSVVALSEIDAPGLHRGLITTVMLLGAVVAAANFMPNGARLVSAGTGLLIISLGIKVLASAVKDISEMSWEDMSRGLVGVGALLASLALFTRLANVNAGGVLTGAGILLLAAGIKVLASALIDISSLSWENVGKGIAVLAASLALMGAALYLIPPSSILSAAAIFIVAASLGMIADALSVMGGMAWGEIGKGLTVLAGALTLIGAALYLIPPTALLSAAGILVVAMALGMIGDAVKSMGGMSWEEIGKGLTVLAVSLGIITAALMLLPAALPGAFALLTVAAALTMLTVVLKTLGGMSWAEIGKGLATLAGVFIVLGVAALLLTPVIPALFGLAAAVALIGAGLALAGAGVFLFATGLTALSVAGAAGTAAIVALVSAVIGLIPMLVEQIGIALLLLLALIVEAAPQIVDAVVIIAIAIIDGLIKLIPKVVEAIVMILDALIRICIEYIPKLVDAGLKVLIGILRGIRDNIREVTVTAGEVIEEFLGGIGDAAPGIIDSGFQLIIDFIEGLTQAIDDNAEEMGEAGADLAIAIIDGMVSGLRSGMNRVVQAAKDVARNALNAALDWLGISSPSKEFIKVGEYSSEGMAVGLLNLADMVSKASERVGEEALTSLQRSLSGLGDVLSSDIDMNPTITPVLDLTNVKRDANGISNLLSAKPIEFEASYSSARVASSILLENREIEADNEEAGSTTYNYNQTINSPKAVSQAETYRQTSNLLSVKKGGLPT